jgi:hypothetical protein
MGYSRAKDNGFAGFAEYLMSHLDPLIYNIACDLHTAL